MKEKIGKKRLNGCWSYLYSKEDKNSFKSKYKVILEFEGKEFEKLSWEVTQFLTSLGKYFADCKIKIKERKC